MIYLLCHCIYKSIIAEIEHNLISTEHLATLTFFEESPWIINLSYRRFRPTRYCEYFFSPVHEHFDAGVLAHTVFIAKCQSYDGRYLITSRLISPKGLLTCIPFLWIIWPIYVVNCYVNRIGPGRFMVEDRRVSHAPYRHPISTHSQPVFMNRLKYTSNPQYRKIHLRKKNLFIPIYRSIQIIETKIIWLFKDIYAHFVCVLKAYLIYSSKRKRSEKMFLFSNYGEGWGGVGGWGLV